MSETETAALQTELAATQQRDALEPLRVAVNDARNRYVQALERLRALIDQTEQVESGTITGGGILSGVITMADEALHGEEHQRRIASARQEVDMSRMEYDDALLRLQAERDERQAEREETRRLAMEAAADAHRKEAARTQHILMIATVVYALLTFLMAAAVGVQAWAAWMQTQSVQCP